MPTENPVGTPKRTLRIVNQAVTTVPLPVYLCATPVDRVFTATSLETGESAIILTQALPPLPLEE